MATCPEGHTSTATDYCDTCGSVITDAGRTDDVAAPSGSSHRSGYGNPEPPKPSGVECPHCQATNLPESLFCEACGYDFTTGTLPRSADTGSWLDIDAPRPEAPTGEPPAPTTETAEAAEVAEIAQAPSDAPTEPEPEPAPHPASSPSLDLDPVPDPAAPPRPTAQSAAPRPAPAAVTEPAGRPISGPVQWVAEIWIDPQWYAEQESPDPLPSPGQPDVVPLRQTSILVGRTSRSRQIFPDLECGADTGISRRQARLTTDGKRWFIEDLDSANGTYVGPAAGALPQQPLTPHRRHELEASDRIYLGAWTRIVLRHATEAESGYRDEP